MSQKAICAVCEKPGHSGRECKAPFRKRWPGKPALKMLLRAPSGSTFEITCEITAEQFVELSAVQLNVIRGIGGSK